MKKYILLKIRWTASIFFNMKYGNTKYFLDEIKITIFKIKISKHFYQRITAINASEF